MEAVRKINIQQIEFSNFNEMVIIYGITEDFIKTPSKSLTRIKIHQDELNRLINQIQASNEDEEVLELLSAEEISTNNIVYTLNLQETSFSNSWISLSSITDNYMLIRA